MSPVELVSFLSTQSIEQKLISDGLVEGETEFDPCTARDYSALMSGSTTSATAATQTTLTCPKGATLYQSAERCYEQYSQKVDFNEAVGTCIKKNALNFIAFNNTDMLMLQNIIRGEVK